MNQDRVVEHQPADSYELSGSKPKAVDSLDYCVQSGDNANKVEILAFTVYMPNMLQLLRLPKGYESSADFYACSTVWFSRRHYGSNINEAQCAFCHLQRGSSEPYHLMNDIQEGTGLFIFFKLKF